MQRVEAAQQAAQADRRVHVERQTETPVMDAAEEAHGEEVRKEQAEKELVQAEEQADVEAAEAAADGDFSASVVNLDESAGVMQQDIIAELERRNEFNSFFDAVDVLQQGGKPHDSCIRLCRMQELLTICVMKCCVYRTEQLI